MKNKQLYNVKAEIDASNNVPVCQSFCSYHNDCANHKSATDWRLKLGATPDLRQVVEGSWRCHKRPVEKLRGAILIDGSLLGDKINGPITWTSEEEIDNESNGFNGFSSDGSF